MKTCRKCNKEKQDDGFYKCRAKKDGLASYCKECSKKIVRVWQKENPDHSKIYYANNRNVIMKNRAWHRNDREKSKRTRGIWRKNNKDKRRASRLKYIAKKFGNGGSFTDKEWKELCDKYKNKCVCCEKKIKLEADHVIPVSKGGTSFISNIQPLCRNCNSSKGNRHQTDYRR